MAHSPRTACPGATFLLPTPREYVDLPDYNKVSCIDFRVCNWNRQDMKVMALQAHIDQNKVWTAADKVLKQALIAGLYLLQDEADDAVKLLRESGGLLFAHAETTRPARIQIGGAL